MAKPTYKKQSFKIVFYVNMVPIAMHGINFMNLFCYIYNITLDFNLPLRQGHIINCI